MDKCLMLIIMYWTSIAYTDIRDWMMENECWHCFSPLHLEIYSKVSATYKNEAESLILDTKAQSKCYKMFTVSDSYTGPQHPFFGQRPILYQWNRWVPTLNIKDQIICCYKTFAGGDTLDKSNYFRSASGIS